MSSASATESRARGGALTVLWQCCAVALFAAGIGWIVGGTQASGLLMLGLGLVVLGGLLFRPSVLALVAMSIVPFTGILASISTGFLAGNTTLSDVVLAAFAVSAFTHREAGSRSRRIPVFPLVIGGLLLLVALIAFLAKPETAGGVFKVGRMALAAFVLLAAARSLTSDHARRCVQFLVYATAASCLLGVVVTIIKAAEAPGQLRLWAGVVDPNYFGVLVAMVLVLAIFGLRARRKGLWIAVLIILLGSEVATLSRSGAIVLAVGVVATMIGVRLARTKTLKLQVPSRLLGLLLLGALLLVGLAVFGPGLTTKAAGRLQEATNPTADTSGAMRIRVFHIGVSLLEQSPLTGSGPGTFQEAVRETGAFKNGLEAHDSLLEATVELGVLGGACLVALLIWGVARGGAGIRRLGLSADALGAQVAVAAWAAFVAGIAGSFMLSNFLYGGSFLAVSAILIAAVSAVDGQPRAS